MQLRKKIFDRIIFQNPYSDPKIDSTENLISSFLRGCVHILNESGEVHITTKPAAGGRWGIENLAPDDDLEFIKTQDFYPEDFPGYTIVTKLIDLKRYSS